MPTNKKTKIVATLGPATSNKDVLKKMMEAGADVFRINFSHANYDLSLIHISDPRDRTRSRMPSSA